MDLQVIVLVGWKTIELNSSINRNQGDIVMRENPMPCPLPNFGQSSATLSLHSTTTSSRNPARGDVQRPSTGSASSVTQTASVPRPTSGPMPVPYPLTTQSSPLSTLPLPSLHRRRPLLRNLLRPPKNRRCRRPPPVRAGGVTELEAGPAAVETCLSLH
jgi:hypothetical protein